MLPNVISAPSNCSSRAAGVSFELPDPRLLAAGNGDSAAGGGPLRFAGARGAAGEAEGLEIGVVATTLLCVCKSLPFLASVRQRHNSSIDSESDSATSSGNSARAD